MLCSWIRRFNISEMSAFPNLLYEFNAIPIKIQRYSLWDLLNVSVEELRLWSAGDSGGSGENRPHQVENPDRVH